MQEIGAQKRIVTWSGGYDSTLCLYKELEKYHYVEAWSFDWNLIDPIKTKCERAVQNRFKKKIKDVGKIDHKIVKLRHDGIVPYGQCVMQTSLFIPLVIYLAPNNSNIIWGFVWKDDFWYWHDKFERLRQMQCDIMCKDIKFEYPLIGHKKYQVIEEINRLQLEACVWTCEEPIDYLEECGKCEPCITYKLAREEQKIRSNLYRDVSLIKNK